MTATPQMQIRDAAEAILEVREPLVYGKALIEAIDMCLDNVIGPDGHFNRRDVAAITEWRVARSLLSLALNQFTAADNAADDPPSRGEGVTAEDRNLIEQIGCAVDNSAVLAKVLAMALADTAMEADAVMALGRLLERLSSEIETIMRRQREA